MSAEPEPENVTAPAPRKLMAGVFGATNEPGTCLYCGRKLTKRARETYWGLFDTGDCAAQFGRAFAQMGKRLKPREPREGAA